MYRDRDTYRGTHTHLPSNAIILPVKQDEHGSDQLGVLDDRLLSPADHGVRDQLLEGAWTERGGGDKSKV